MEEQRRDSEAGWCGNTDPSPATRRPLCSLRERFGTHPLLGTRCIPLDFATDTKSNSMVRFKVDFMRKFDLVHDNSVCNQSHGKN